jgi:cold shock CspA family protein
MSKTGAVLFYDEAQRFGFARVDGEPDVYIGHGELARSGIERLREGDVLRFEVHPERLGQRPRAVKIRIVSEPTA